MKQVVSQKGFRVSIFAFIFIAAYAINISLSFSSGISPDIISVALLIDLCVWVPVLYHFLLARPGIGPKFVTRLLLSIGTISSLVLIPETAWLASFKMWYGAALLFLFVSLLSLTAIRLLAAFPQSKRFKGEERIVYLAGKAAPFNWCKGILKSELIALYYAFYGWRLTNLANGKDTFSYHMKSGSVGLIIGISVFHIPGIVFAHIIFMQVWPLIALILTVAHLYMIYFGLSQAMAMKNRMIAIDDNFLTLRCGLLFDAKIPLSIIQSIKPISGLEAEIKKRDRIHATMFGFANTKITFNRSYRLPIFAGLSKSCNELIIGLDEPMLFRKSIEKHNG